MVLTGHASRLGQAHAIESPFIPLREGAFPPEMALEQDTGRPGGASAERRGSGHGRILVIANETIGGRELLDEIARRAGDGREVHVVAPALVRSRLKQGMGDVDQAIQQASRRLESSIQAMRERGLKVTGEVGDADPNLAIVDALRLFPADEVIISTHPKERSAWLEKDVVERARQEIDKPITHVVVDLDAGPGEGPVRDVRELEPEPRPKGWGRDEEDQLAYLPPLTTRDRITLAVAVIGTIILGLLAIDCGSFEGGCAARMLIAIGAFMISVWHVVALIFFRSAGYRGPWASFAANTVLFAMPPAILISALLG
jgi:hypothetical protein